MAFFKNFGLRSQVCLLLWTNFVQNLFSKVVGFYCVRKSNSNVFKFEILIHFCLNTFEYGWFQLRPKVRFRTLDFDPLSEYK